MLNIIKYSILTLLILLTVNCGAFSQESIPDSSQRAFQPVEYGDLEDERPKEPRIVSYDYDRALDSLFLCGRLNLANDAVRTFQQNAGDFLRPNPSNLVINYQSTPIRTNVSPFALPGNRMGVLLDNRVLNLIEHLPEPDNLTDFNDIPTAPMQRIYNIEGPLGIILGGDQAASSLIMKSHIPDTTRVESKLSVDKGSFGYAYTKGSLYHVNEDGRMMRLALGYRKSDGIVFYADDDAYHQWAELSQPLSRRWLVALGYRLYKRVGSFPPRFDAEGFFVDRFRRDRDLTAVIDLNHSDNQKSSLEFRHQRSESKIEKQLKAYRRFLDDFSNGLTYSFEGLNDRIGYKFMVSLAEERFDDKNYLSDKRRRGDVELAVLPGNNISVRIRGTKVSGFDPAPSGAIAYQKSTEKFHLSASAGYSTIFPSQYELFLSPRSDAVYATSPDYLESGNHSLTTEKQLIGNLSLGLGRVGSDILLSVTGGKITDGIDWMRFDTLGLARGGYRPGNHDIDFVNGTIRQRLSLWNRVFWIGGAAYRYIEHSDNDNPAYAPEYQGYTGLELYQYIDFLELHLYAYGELLYAGPYTGYNGEELGEDPVFNLKLTFRVKKFRFYYIFQDVPSIEYNWREDYIIPGRYNYYGITWEFLD